VVTIIQGQRGNNEPTGEIDEHREDIPKQNDWIKSRHTAKSFLTTSVTILDLLYNLISVSLKIDRQISQTAHHLTFVPKKAIDQLNKEFSSYIKAEGKHFNKLIF